MAVEIEAVIGLIIAVSGLIGVVGGLLGKFVQFKRQVLNRTDEIDDKVIWTADQLSKTDDWVLENQDKLTTIGNVITSLSPQTKQILIDKGIDIKTWTAEINRIQDELKKIQDIRIADVGTKTSIEKAGT